MKKEKLPTTNRKMWFRIVKQFLKIFIRKTRVIHLGDSFTRSCIILSNHVGARAPLAIELYGLKQPFRFWGTYEMNSSFRELYAYETKIYYHQKKHWPLFWARLFCVIAAPVTYIHYRGTNFISTYEDFRLKETFKQSLEVIEKNETIVIFPEDSSKGYFDVLTAFHPGFVLLGNQCLKKGYDLPVYATYYHKKKHVWLVDKPILFSELIANGDAKEVIAQRMCDRVNALGKMDIDSLIKEEKHQSKLQNEILNYI